MRLKAKVALGTVQAGLKYGISNHEGQITLSELQNILFLAKTEGVNTIDTAHGYGDAEERLGKFDLQTFQIISKFLPSEQYGSLKNQLQEGLDKLNVKSVYAYLAHRPESLLYNDEWRQLNELKEGGKVNKIGFSLNRPEELTLLLKKHMVPDLIQVPFNYFDNRFVKDMVSLKEKGCEIHTRSAFLQGLFFCDVNQLSAFFDTVKPIIKELRKKNGGMLPGILLNYCLKKDYIDKVVIGINNAMQLQQNLQDLALEKEELSDNMFSIAEEILMPSKWPK